MRKAIAALAGTAVLLGLAGASFANHSIPKPGVVHSVDHARNLVMFQDGTTFQVGPGVEVNALTPGTQVIFYYLPQNGNNVVVSYEFP
jgi:hypothetical protein